jgi:hypothetical protein
MSVPEYYVSLSDEEVDKIINFLTPYQKEKFDGKLKEFDGDKRHALFIAKSFDKVKREWELK